MKHFRFIQHIDIARLQTAYVTTDWKWDDGQPDDSGHYPSISELNILIGTLLSRTKKSGLREACGGIIVYPDLTIRFYAQLEAAYKD